MDKTYKLGTNEKYIQRLFFKIKNVEKDEPTNALSCIVDISIVQ